MHHRGREQLVPAVLRPGRQKRPCGAFLERGRVPGEVPGQQRATGVEPCGNAGLFFCCSIPERCEQKVHHRGREQLVPAVLRPGRQKRPCGAFFRARESPRGSSRPAARDGGRALRKRRAVFLLQHPGTLRTKGAPSGTRTARAGRLTSRPAKTPLRGVFRARKSPRGSSRPAARDGGRALWRVPPWGLTFGLHARRTRTAAQAAALLYGE